MPVALMVGTAGAAKTVPRFAALPARARLSAPPSNVSSVALRRARVASGASADPTVLRSPDAPRCRDEGGRARTATSSNEATTTRLTRPDPDPLSQATPLTFHRVLMPRRAPLGVAVRATVAPPPSPPPPWGRADPPKATTANPVPDMTDTYRILAVLGAIYAADAMFLALGAPAACVVSPTVAAGAGVIASAAVVYASSLWDRFASSSSAAAAADAVIRAVDVARCLVAATGSVLALIIVEALRTSKAVTAATCAGSALVFVGAYFAKEMDKGLTVTVTKPGATAPDVPPTRVGMQGTPSDKELTRLEAIRQILLEEFMEEEARLAAAEENKKSEVLRLEAIYETRIKTLGREITILKNKNAELSVFAGKAASHDSLKQRAETEIATLKKARDAEISALKAQISGLEATIADVEAKMAAERAAMAEQLRAARGQYTAQKALFDSEMRKYRAALSLAAQHTEWWKAVAAHRARRRREARRAP